MTTIMWSVGVAALVPSAVYAADQGDEVACSSIVAGDMIKLHGGAAIYMVNSDMTRSWFANGDVFKSWNSDDKYATYYQFVTSECMASFSTGGAVMPRPGSYLVKETGSDIKYAVLPGNKIAQVNTESEKLYAGKKVLEIDPATWAFYGKASNKAANLTENKPHEGMLVKNGSNYYVVGAGSTLRKVTSEGLTANRYRTSLAYTLAATTGFTMGDDVTALETSLADRSQGLAGDTTTGTGTVVGGNLTVSLSANSPEAANVVINVDNVVFGKFVFKAGADHAVTVNAVKMARKGLGAIGDIASVTLYDGGTKLGSTKTNPTLATDNSFTYNVSGGWVIPAGTSKELTVAVKLDTAGTYNALGIVGVTGEGLEVGGLPVYGNEMSGVDVEIGTTTVTNVGTSATKKIGTSDVTLAQFKLTMNSVEAGKFESVILKNKGTATDADVANLYLYKGSTKLAGPVQMASDKVTFVLESPYLIDKSKNESFKVVGDIVKGAANTVAYVVENTGDLKVMGQTYGAYTKVGNADYNGIGESATTTIDGAELSLSYTGTNLDTVDDKTDVEFGKLTLSAGATDIKITGMVLTVDETDGNSSATDNKDVDDLELVDEATGAAYSGVMTGGDGTDGVGTVDDDNETWTYSDEIYLAAGESHTYIIRGDLPAGIGNGDSYKVTMTVNSTNLTAETVPEGDTVSNFSIGSFTGKVITVKSPTLKVSGVSQNNGTAVVNDENVILFKGTLEASADDIKVTYADFDANSVFSTDNWTQVGFYLVDSAGAYVSQQIVTKSDMTSGTMAFDSLDFTVKNGPTNKVTFVIKGTVASTLNGATGAALKLDYMTVKDTDNNDAGFTDSSGTDLSASGSTWLTTGGRTVTLGDKGKLYIQIRNNDVDFNKDQVVLAGKGFWAGKIKVKADDEDIKIKDLKLNNIDTTADRSVDTVCLYSAKEVSSDKLIGCATMVSGVVFFDNIDKTVTQGTNYWYVYVNSKAMSDQANDTAISHDMFQFGITSSTTSLVAEGVRSGYTFTYAGNDASAVLAGEYAFDYDLDDSYNEVVDVRTASTTIYHVAGNKPTSVTLVSQTPDGAVKQDTLLSGSGDYVAAILAVTADNSTNVSSTGSAIKLEMDAIRFDVDKFDSTTISAVTIERYGGVDGAKGMEITSISAQGSTGSVTTSSMSSIFTGGDYKIDPGTTAYFVVKATVNGLNTADNTVNWFRFDMDDLKGSVDDANNNVDWKDGASAVNYDFLYLGTDSLTGTKIAGLSGHSEVD